MGDITKHLDEQVQPNLVNHLHDHPELGPEPAKSTSREDSPTLDNDNSFNDDLSDDESICRSPTKTPAKKVTSAASKDYSLLPSDEDFQFKKPKFRKKKFIFHPFVRNKEGVCVPDCGKEAVEVTIPEQLAASYGLYIWPASPVLAWYIWLNQVGNSYIRCTKILETKFLYN